MKPVREVGNDFFDRLGRVLTRPPFCGGLDGAPSPKYKSPAAIARGREVE